MKSKGAEPLLNQVEFDVLISKSNAALLSGSGSTNAMLRLDVMDLIKANGHAHLEVGNRSVPPNENLIISGQRKIDAKLILLHCTKLALLISNAW